MSAEIAQECIVVRREVAYTVVLFRTRVDDGSGMVREAGEVGAVFLAHERFYVFSFFGIVEEEGIVGAGGQAEFARVVKVEGCYGGFGFGEFELLVDGLALSRWGVGGKEEFVGNWRGKEGWIPWLDEMFL